MNILGMIILYVIVIAIIIYPFVRLHKKLKRKKMENEIIKAKYEKIKKEKD